MTSASPIAVDRSSGFRRRWALAFLFGELVGFVPPAVTGATLAAIGTSDAVLVLGLTIAGSFEGALLGVAQARVLERDAPELVTLDACVAYLSERLAPA